jgi:hypothetical protein
MAFVGLVTFGFAWAPASDAIPSARAVNAIAVERIPTECNIVLLL